MCSLPGKGRLVEKGFRKMTNPGAFDADQGDF